MGRSFRALATHDLPFDDINALATKLSEIFNVNVYIIFQSYINLRKIDESIRSIREYGLNAESDGTFYVYDIIIIDRFGPNMMLEYDDYMYHWLKLKLGDQVGADEQVISHWTPNIKENNDIIQSFIDGTKSYLAYVDTGPFKDMYLDIFQGSITVFNNSFQFYGWWNLHGTLTQNEFGQPLEVEEESMRYLLDFRNRNVELFKLLGCSEAYYIGERSKHTDGIGQGNEYDTSKSEIEAILKSEDCKKHQAHFGEIAVNRDYMLEMHTASKKDNHEFISVFYDDFEPIDSEAAVKNVDLELRTYF